jgi:hypothetical protein
MGRAFFFFCVAQNVWVGGATAAAAIENTGLLELFVNIPPNV